MKPLERMAAERRRIADLPATLDPAGARPALDITAGWKGAIALDVRHHKLVRFEATDQEWSSGFGPLVSGDSGSLLLVMMGRCRDDHRLAGPGVAVLQNHFVGSKPA